MIRSTVYCTNCGGDFIVELNLELNGNHQITCPLCGHIHYRVVKDGEVTEDRWQSSAGLTYIASTYYNITTSTTITSSANITNYFVTSSWLNRTDLNLT